MKTLELSFGTVFLGNQEEVKECCPELWALLDRDTNLALDIKNHRYFIADDLFETFNWILAIKTFIFERYNDQDLDAYVESGLMEKSKRRELLAMRADVSRWFQKEESIPSLLYSIIKEEFLREKCRMFDKGDNVRFLQFSLRLKDSD